MKGKLSILLVGVPIILWVLLGCLGHKAAATIAARFGSRILAIGDGKFTHVQPFVEGRLNDAVLILTTACLLLLVHGWLAALANRRWTTPRRWIAQAWSAFICLNIFAACAAHTALFWCVLYTGKNNVNNYTQWNVKNSLLKEIETPSQALLLGSSQSRAQIDTKVLNNRLNGRIWTTELHFPGSSIYDMILCLQRTPKSHVDYVITYVSEPTFFSSVKSDDRLMYFFGLGDLVDYWQLGSGRPDFDRYLVCGLMGDAFPLYRVWESLLTRARSWQTRNAAQENYDATLDRNLANRAQVAAKSVARGQQSEFQKKAFVTLANLCRQRNCRLIVCCGQLNPIYERALDPSLRPEMIAFLREQAAKDPTVVLLDESQLPPQQENDYEDLTHVNLATRARFSQFIGEVLDKLDVTKHVATSDQAARADGDSLLARKAPFASVDSSGKLR